MMGLNADVMTSYAGDPVKSVQHILALAIAGFAVYVGHAHFIEQRVVGELSLQGMGRELMQHEPVFKRMISPEFPITS